MLFTLVTICGISTRETERPLATRPPVSPAVAPASNTTPPPPYTVTSVLDGATVEVTGADGVQRRISVRGIRAPSVDSCFGTETFAWAAATLIGTTVTPRTESGDPPGRIGTTEADLILPDGENYAVAALTGGYVRFSGTHAPDSLGPSLQRAEHRARSAVAGLWGAPCHGNLEGNSSAGSASP
ncbi:thermonuclease family protein [Amycolatopsis aidingensis]|uniref:thermonuclease family protein n=1 Tax=Amycolatopsis aidingensis TaxID=2842453 RepID=UPI001C0C638F|nr:hypothetical protein [Amycolatopsis aidingensis]